MSSARATFSFPQKASACLALCGWKLTSIEERSIPIFFSLNKRNKIKLGGNS